MGPGLRRGDPVGGRAMVLTLTAVIPVQVGTQCTGSAWGTKSPPARG